MFMFINRDGVKKNKLEFSNIFIIYFFLDVLANFKHFFFLQSKESVLMVLLRIFTLGLVLALPMKMKWSRPHYILSARTR